MANTTFFTGDRRFSPWHKFIATLIIGVLILIADAIIHSDYLQYIAGGTFLFSMYFLVMIVMELVDKLNQS